LPCLQDENLWILLFQTRPKTHQPNRLIDGVLLPFLLSTFLILLLSPGFLLSKRSFFPILLKIFHFAPWQEVEAKSRGAPEEFAAVSIFQQFQQPCPKIHINGLIHMNRAVSSGCV